MDLFNRPPSIADDVLSYSIIPHPDDSDNASVTTLAALIYAHTASLLPDHIWHRDAFEVKVTHDEAAGHRWYLTGRMRVGDCVDDEWLVVWLLKQLSAKWDLVISVIDTDGEFLLIEAADHLPAWVTPTNAENRVWIHNSHLHLIPLSYVSAFTSSTRPGRRAPVLAGDSDDEGEADEDYLSVEDAVRLVRDPRVETLSAKAAESVVWAKISRYPALIRNHLHTGKVHLPIDVARSLICNPSLVQKAVEAFYTRDALQLRAAQRMSRFPPHPDVLTTVRMTRTAYAQLAGQKFHHPKVFGMWQEREGTMEWSWKDVGMKIACGFEMLYQESRGRASAQSTVYDPTASADARKDALHRVSEYNDYIKKLVSTSYFEGEIEGSQKWGLLETKAAATFIDVRRDSDAERTSFAELVDDAVIQAGNMSLGPVYPEESDQWLRVDSNDFEAMIQTRAGVPALAIHSGTAPSEDAHAMDVDGRSTTDVSRSPADAEEARAQEQAKRLKGLADQVESFVEGEGALEGARFNDDLLSDEEFSDNDDSYDGDSDGEMEREAAENSHDDASARRTAMDNLVPALAPEEYGQMPASFYTNSQRTAPEVPDEEGEPDVSGASDAPRTGLTTSTSTSVPLSSAATPKSQLRRPTFTRDQYDGVDSDDESDEEREQGLGIIDPSDGEESDGDRPQVVGDVEIDMAEEQEDFIRFSREALGLSEDQFAGILRERAARGATIPHSLAASLNRSASNGSKSSVPGGDDLRGQLRSPEPGPRPNRNPNLDSFEAVMVAMDTELSRVRQNWKGAGASAAASKAASLSSRREGKQKATVEGAMDDDDDDPTGLGGDTDLDDEDVEGLMDGELRAALDRLGDVDDLDHRDGEGGESGDAGGVATDYNLIRNFLESFKSQGGLPGPVSSLAGRLQPGWTLPRDEV